jgi:hypothetical protein
MGFLGAWISVNQGDSAQNLGREAPKKVQTGDNVYSLYRSHS